MTQALGAPRLPGLNEMREHRTCENDENHILNSVIVFREPLVIRQL